MSVVVSIVKSLAAITILPIAVGLIFGVMVIIEYWPQPCYSRAAGLKASRVRG